MQTASSFFEEELSSINLNDARLNKRAFKIGDNLLSNPGSCIQSLTDDKNEARCPYDFFSNPKVNWMHLLLPHRQSTLQRISSNSSEHIYIIQDSTFYNYTSHTAKVDLGVIGKQGSHIQLGLMQHTSFCVDSNDIPLGILELDFMGYEDSQKYSSHRSDFEAIASSRWRRFVSQNIKELKDNKYKQKVILLCDREADFFELHNDLRHGDLKFIIRCKYINRPTGKSARARKNRITELLKKQFPLGRTIIELTHPKTHKEYSSSFTMKSLENVLIPPVHRGANHRQNKLDPVKMNIVEVSNDDLSWLLLTNLPVKTFNQVRFVIESYKKRWHIETFHKVLKTAYDADKIYLHHSRDAIQNLLTMINIAAYQTYYLISQSRLDVPILAKEMFSIEEIQAVNVYFSSNINDIPTLKEFYAMVVKLGGHKNERNKHPPGILVIYRGIKKLNHITQMYKVMMSSKT